MVRKIIQKPEILRITIPLAPLYEIEVLDMDSTNYIFFSKLKM